jgi:hypothetical protein
MIGLLYLHIFLRGYPALYAYLPFKNPNEAPELMTPTPPIAETREPMNTMNPPKPPKPPKPAELISVFIDITDHGSIKPKL